MDIQINTAKVRESADRLEKINNDIKQYYRDSHDKILQLKRGWSGKAADDLIPKIIKLETNNIANGSRELCAIVKLIKVGVGDAYEETEEQVKNVSLAFR